MAGCRYCCKDEELTAMDSLFNKGHYMCHSCGRVSVWNGADPECCGECGSPKISYEAF